MKALIKSFYEHLQKKLTDKENMATQLIWSSALKINKFKITDFDKTMTIKQIKKKLLKEY